MQIQTVTLNVVPNGVPPIIDVTQNDNGRIIQLALKNGSAAYNLLDRYSYVLCGTKPSGTGFSYDDAVSTIGLNVLVFNTNTVMTAVAGDVRCGIIIYDGDEHVETLNFILRVQRTALEADTIIDSSDFESTIRTEVLEFFEEAASEMLGVASISYRQFGAVLDGSTDDSAAIVAAHEYANEHALKVEQHDGTLRVNFKVTVKTSCDFTGMTFIIDDNTRDGAYTLFHEEAYPANIGSGSSTSPSFTAGGAMVSDDRLFGKLFFIDKNPNNATAIGNRKNGNTMTIGTADTLIQPLMTDPEGYFISAPPVMSITKARCRWISDIFESPIYWRGGKVIVDRSEYGNTTMILVERNNVTISDMTIVPSGNASTNAEGDGVISLTRCCNIVVERVRALNNSKNTVPPSSYIVNQVYTANVSFVDCLWSYGWGGHCSHYTSGVSFERCIMNRVDNHRGNFGDWHISNCTFVGFAYIVLGCGNANLSLDNVRFYKNVQRQTYYIGPRFDYQPGWCGVLTLNNVRCEDATGTAEALLTYDRRAKVSVDGTAENVDPNTDFTNNGANSPMVIIKGVYLPDGVALVSNLTGNSDQHLPEIEGSTVTAAAVKYSVPITRQTYVYETDVIE